MFVLLRLCFTEILYCNLLYALYKYNFSGHQLSELICDSSGRIGAGVLDLKFESPNILLSCGYDTAVRLWDMRIGGR